MSTPATVAEFHTLFPSWPNDSLSNRTDPISSGSSWGLRDIGTFQVLYSAPLKEPPIWLADYTKEANARVNENEPMQSLLRLFKQKWQKLTHEELTKFAGPFASFAKLLSQVLETPISSESHRELRAQPDFQGSTDIPITSLSSSSPLSSSPPEYPNKKIRAGSSSSYWPSDESEQSAYNQRIKSEATTNTCIYELLSCVTEISRKETDPPFRLEWTITQDTITVQAGSHNYSTKNDGGLLHKGHYMGCWQRVSNCVYCAIEVKSWHDTAEKPSNVKAQEAAHIIAMFSQRSLLDNHPQHNIVVPLVSGAQNLFSLVLGNFSAQYRQYLHDGSQSEESEELSFIKIEEYGRFKMQDPEDLKIIFIIVVALNLKLQDLGRAD